MELLFDSHIGRGAFADVWLAKDALQRSVAVKFFNDTSPSQLEKNALDHARALTRVKHAAVVQVLAVERQTHPETGADALCIIMEFADGPNLSLHNTALTAKQASLIVADISGGLSAIHDVGLVHGDLHEANVIITPVGAKLIDILYTHSLAEVSTTFASRNRTDDLRALAIVLHKVLEKTPCAGLDLEAAHMRAASSLDSVSSVRRPYDDLLSRALLPKEADGADSVSSRGVSGSANAPLLGSPAGPAVAPGLGASPLARWRTAKPHARLLTILAGLVLLASLSVGVWKVTRASEQTSLVYDAQEEACKSGDLRGCVDQGNSLYTGRGVSRDPVRAFELFSKACEAGEPLGCLSRGWAHYSGTGTRKDASAAALDFERTCNDTIDSGCYGLGILYRDGTGRPKDPAVAARLIKRACDAGFGPGCGK